MGNRAESFAWSSRDLTCSEVSDERQLSYQAAGCLIMLPRKPGEVVADSEWLSWVLAVPRPCRRRYFRVVWIRGEHPSRVCWAGGGSDASSSLISLGVLVVPLSWRQAPSTGSSVLQSGKLRNEEFSTVILDGRLDKLYAGEFFSKRRGVIATDLDGLRDGTAASVCASWNGSW